MGLTDELRRVAAKTECANGRCEKLYRGDLDRIADRIDAEHERVCKEQYARGVEHGISANIEASTIQERIIIVPLKDADDVPICIGDVLTDDAEFKSEGKVTRLMLEDDGWMVGFECGGWTNPSIHEWHHYHAPTVEDVLREFAMEFNRDDSELCDGEIIERFAAKLRLKEDA